MPRTGKNTRAYRLRAGVIMIVVFVTGDRRWTNKELIHSTLAQFPKGSWLLEGGASGADRLAREAGSEHGLQCFTAWANWGVYHRAAGPMRNRNMGQLLATFVKAGAEVHAFAFHNNIAISKGTKDMIGVLDRVGIKCPIISEDSATRAESERKQAARVAERQNIKGA